MQTNPEWSRVVSITGVFCSSARTDPRSSTLFGAGDAGEHGPAVWVSCGFPLFIYTFFIQPQLEAARCKKMKLFTQASITRG